MSIFVTHSVKLSYSLFFRSCWFRHNLFFPTLSFHIFWHWPCAYVHSRTLRPSQHRQYMFHELNHPMFGPYQRFDALPQNKSRHSVVNSRQRFANRYGILQINQRNVERFNEFRYAQRIEISIFIEASNVQWLFTARCSGIFAILFGCVALCTECWIERRKTGNRRKFIEQC